jgi:hypothetical protein
MSLQFRPGEENKYLYPEEKEKEGSIEIPIGCGEELVLGTDPVTKEAKFYKSKLRLCEECGRIERRLSEEFSTGIKDEIIPEINIIDTMDLHHAICDLDPPIPATLATLYTKVNICPDLDRRGALIITRGLKKYYISVPREAKEEVIILTIPKEMDYSKGNRIYVEPGQTQKIELKNPVYLQMGQRIFRLNPPTYKNYPESFNLFLLLSSH